MNKRIAEALVECHFADRIVNKHGVIKIHVTGSPKPHLQDVDPFYLGEPIFECHARRQADALEDWLWDFGNEVSLWNRSEVEVDFPPMGGHRQWRLDRIKYCFEQLEKDNG